MHKILFLFFLCVVCPSSLQATGAYGDAGLTAYVDILQGTDLNPTFSHGNTLPLVGAPWGMIDWSIENGPNPWFFQPNGKLDGLRATHQPSPWIDDYGQF